MRAIVLVKQVPDVRVGIVGTRPDGTIDRASAPAITNPADLHALEAALQLADEVWAVSMGPARAEETLRQAVALGADRGVLVTDRLFAGSDTWATANAMAAAIAHLGGCDLILCGISALDGETGQVGPQVAQRLGIPQATGCEDLNIVNERLVARRIVEGGYEILSLPLPALVTIAETGFTPRYPTLPGRRRGASAQIEILTAADLDLDDTLVGLKASPTKVARMELVPKPKVDCKFVGVDIGYDDLVDELRAREAVESEEVPPIEGDHIVKDELPPRLGRPSLWVVCETRDGLLARVSAELLSKATELAPDLGGGVAAVCIGSDVETAAQEASRYGADVALIAEDDRLSPYRCLPQTRIIRDAIEQREPEAVLFGATTTGRDLAPRVAAMLNTGIAADCTDLYVDHWKRQNTTYRNLLHQVRPAMAGGVLATCLCPEARPQMATIRPGVFPPTARPRQPRVERLSVDLSDGDLVVDVLEHQLQRTEVGLADANVIIAGGAGCNASNWHLIEDLAHKMSGKVAASRGAVEAGLVPRSLQIGQTGTTVRPRLYIACGISGALQHVVGMRSAETIVAINRDPAAAIFRYAHFGIVGEVADVLPTLTDALEQQIAGER
jgi:electron transfer flavoprotein alpha subunit